MGWTSLPLLKKMSSQDEEMPDSCPSQTHESEIESQRQSAPLLVLPLTEEQAALAAPESNQLLHLQLRKRCYAEAVNIMRMVKGAMCACACSSSFPFCFHPHPHCFPSERRVADAFPLLIVLAYFLWVLGIGR